MQPTDIESDAVGSRRYEGSVAPSGLTSLLARLPVSLLLVNPAGEIAGGGGAPHELLGNRAPAELEGQSADEVLCGAPHICEALEAARSGTEREALLQPDGAQVIARALPLGEGGAALLLISIENGCGDSQLAASGLELFLERAPATVWLADDHLTIVQATGSLLGRLGFTPESVAGQPLTAVFQNASPSDPVVAYHRAALDGESGRFRYRYARRWYDVLLEPVRDARQQVVGCAGLAIDVTRQVRREHRLEHSQARLAEAQRIAHVGSWEWDVRSDRLFWSEELKRICGVQDGFFFGNLEGFLNRIHPDDREGAQRCLLKVMQSGGAFADDHRIVLPSGEIRMLQTAGEAILGEHGEVRRLVGSCADVTERWKAQQSLEKSLSLLQATLDSTADGLLVVDRKGRLIAWNDRFLVLWRIPRHVAEHRDDEAALQVVLEQLEDPRGFRERVRSLYDQPELESYDVLRFHDGRVFERYSRPHRLGQEVVGRVWSFRDVTERERLLQRALLLAEAGRLLASLEVEKAVESVARLALRDFAEGCVLDLFGGDRGPRRLVSLSTSGEPMNVEVPRTALAGHPLLFEVEDRSCLAVPIEARKRIGVLMFRARPGRDFGDGDLDFAGELAGLLALAFENARLYRRAREAAAARDEFLSVAAHEIRGPTAALRLAVEGIRTGRLSETKTRSMLDLAERQVKMLSRLIDQLLDVARIRTRKLHLEFEPLDLAEVVRDAAARHTLELSRSGSVLRVHAESGARGEWDRLRLEQLVSNLLGNAIKFGRGKPIELEVLRARDEAIIVVRDHGIGIPKEKQQLIFQPFERAVTARQHGGLGLGLYICRSIVDALGGTMSVESEPGEGTAFTVRLPLEPVR